MSERELRRTYRVAAEPAQVLAHLAEPSNYIGLSPLLTAVRDVREHDGVVHYGAVERFRLLGLIPHDNVIRVTLETRTDQLPDGGAVYGEVISPGGVRMRYSFVVARDEGGGSTVHDSLWLTAPLGLGRFAAGKAAAVQSARGRVLAQRLEGPRSAAEAET